MAPRSLFPQPPAGDNAGFSENPMPDVATGAWLSGAGATFALITLAEFGDKSQLVCIVITSYSIHYTKLYEGWKIMFIIRCG